MREFKAGLSGHSLGLFQGGPMISSPYLQDFTKCAKLLLNTMLTNYNSNQFEEDREGIKEACAAIAYEAMEVITNLEFCHESLGDDASKLLDKFSKIFNTQDFNTSSNVAPAFVAF